MTPVSIRFQPASRLPRIPIVVLLAVVGAALLLIGSEFVLAQGPAPGPGEVRTTCMLRRTTGVPCPSCGGTRAAKAAFQLDFVGAFQNNPLIVSVAVVLLVLFLLRFVTARSMRLELSTTGWVIVAGFAVVAVAANWVWVLRQHGFFLGQ